MSSLMAEIEKLSLRNQNLMMTRLSTAKEAATTDDQEINNETLGVWVSDYVYPELASSSDEEMRMVELRVSVRSGGESSQVDVLTTRLLEFLKRVQNVTLISMAANTHITQGTTAINQLTFRLTIIEVCTPKKQKQLRNMHVIETFNLPLCRTTYMSID